MITMKNLQVEDIKDEWLYNALTQGIKECITAPVLTLDPTKPEPIKRAEMILENFSQEDSPVVATVIAPGNFIQMILPKHEILLSVMFIYKERNTYVQLIIQKLAYEREKITTKTKLPPRLMVLIVILKGVKMYRVPVRSEIELDHLKDFNTLRRILTPLVQLYHGVGFDTRLTYDEFSIFFNDLQYLGYELLNEYHSGIQESIEVKPITKSDQDIEEIRKGLLISLKS